jgi:two-component system OmpR family sensor kinase
VPATGCATTGAGELRLPLRLPIRVRLTLAFAVAMAVVITATGAFLYFRLGATLDHTIDQGLRSRADDLAASVRRGDSRLSEARKTRLATEQESVAQVLAADGAVVDATPLLHGRPLLDRAALGRATQSTIVVDGVTVPGSDDPFRLLATPIEARGERRVIVVAASLEARDEALDGLLTQLLLGGPLALLLSSLAGYAVAAGALRPVESMRREAEEVSASEPGRRLPVSPARDELGRLGETLNEMLGRLETALARERRFVADASHELRTPLALLRTELELALRHPRTPEQLEAALRSAAEETDRLSQLAEDLLVLARADQGRLPLRRERLSAAELLAGVGARQLRRAQRAGRRLEVDAHTGVELHADRLRVEQALGNLVENALRHGTGRIVLSAAKHDGRVELHVRDEGPGFPEPFVGRAFERFSRAEVGRSSSGAGLGLAIADVIARAHGGSAHVANTPGGTDVWLSLPGEQRQ